jgi:hypothetical protein
MLIDGLVCRRQSAVGEVGRQPRRTRFNCARTSSHAPLLHTTLSDTRPIHRSEAVLKPRPPRTALPRLPASPFQRAVSNTPANLTGVCVDCFPVRAAFPEKEAGRRLPRFFRGLLDFHSRYGPFDRSVAAQGGVCHEASTRPVAQPRRS